MFFLILWNDNLVSFAWTHDSHLCFVSIWTTITLNLNNLLDTYPFPTYISFLDKITLFDLNTIRDLCLFKSNSKMRLFQISSIYKTLFRVRFSQKSSFFLSFYLKHGWIPHIEIFTISNRFKRNKNFFIWAYMLNGTSINPLFYWIGVYHRNHCRKINAWHMFWDVLYHIIFTVSILLW